MTSENATAGEDAGNREPSGPSASDGYDHRRVEARWQAAWRDAGTFEAPADPDPETARYVLGMFPYTSGELHMGHVRNYALTDAYARYRRMRGDDVLHPIGWDAFGLPAENAALAARDDDPDADGVDRRADPAVTPESYTRDCIAAMREAFQSLGLGYDWTREFATCDPEYYRWNQWLFTQFRDAGLVDRQERGVNWCPSCETVLADEQVEESSGHDTNRSGESAEVCWRCETPVGERDLEQWFFRITEYADELLDALDDLERWPASVRDQQRNWIGRTTGAEVDFTVHVPDDAGSTEGGASEERDDGCFAEGGANDERDDDTGSATIDHDVTVFTTRLDTIHGATFVALAPDHPLAEAAADRDDDVRQFVEHVADPEGSDPQGVETDMTATNPATGEEIPVFVADFVLSDVGTGALMAVPAHDERDHAFARAHGVEIRQVVEPDGEETVDVQEAAFTDDGVLVNSGEYDGLSSAEAREALTEGLSGATSAIQYRLRDWEISRQRYWGTPIPVVHCEDCGPVSVPDDDLPVELPEFVPSTGNPLDAATEWKQTTCPDCGRPAERETDTMDTFVGSSWYYARFAGGPGQSNSPGSSPDAPFDRDAAATWLPVDEYVGGDEHAVMHLLYARFVAKALRDLEYLDVDEPFEGLTTQGMVLGEDGAKMSKSRGNGVSPERIVDEYGADTARTFVLGAAEPERDFPWNPEGVKRRRRLLDRVHDLATAESTDRGCVATGIEGVASDTDAVATGVDAATVERGLSPTDEYVAREVDATVDAVTTAAEAMRFDRVVRDVDELVGLVGRYGETDDADPAVLARAVSVIVRALAPIAPHVCEDAWDAIGDGLVATTAWPAPERDLADHDAATHLVESTHADVRDIVDTAGIDDPERIEVVVAPEWTYRALELVHDAVGDSGDSQSDPGEFASAVMADEAMRERGEAAAAYAQELDDAGTLPTPLGAEREREALDRAAWLLEREFDATVDVKPAADASDDLASGARPGRPAIHVHERDA